MVARERFAWVDLVGMIVAYGGFFVEMGRAEPSVRTLVILFAIATAVRLAILAAAYVSLSAEARAELRGRPDERDRAVSRRSALIAYYVLLAGMCVVGVIMPFSYDGLTVATAALGGVVAAEVVRHVAIVSGYRWGWRG